MDRIKDSTALDHLSRLLVDVQQDNSAIVSSIISQYQRDLLQLIFLGDADYRNKVNLLMANEIAAYDRRGAHGQGRARERAEAGHRRHEGRVRHLRACARVRVNNRSWQANSRHHEPLLCAYLQFVTIDIFAGTTSADSGS